MNGTEIVVGGNVYRTLEAQVYNNKERLDSLDIETLEGLPDAFEDLDTRVDGIDDRLVIAEGDISDIKGDVQDLDQDINGTGGIEDRLGTAEQNISDSAGDILQLQYDLGEAQGDINALGTSKLDAPTDAGNVGDVIVKASSGTEWQAVAPFDPNGTYPNVTVGKAVIAKDIQNVSEASGSDQDDPFIFQGTATENNTGSTPSGKTAKVKNVFAKTYCYNQLVDGVNLSYQTISGHKYWSYISATDFTTIITSSGNPITISDAQKDLIVDLTLWFNGNANIPQEILDDALMFPGNYYNSGFAYNAGLLIDTSIDELFTIGLNQWDEESESGGFDSVTGAPTPDANKIRSKNYIPVIPNTEYYFYFAQNKPLTVYYYDSNKSFLSLRSGAVNSYSSTPKNCRYIKFAVGSSTYPVTTYSNDICINLHWDGAKDGTYEPYVKKSYTVNLTGKSAGSAHKYKLPDGTEYDYVGEKTFDGTETWFMTSYGGFNFFYIELPSNAVQAPQGVCDRYVCRNTGSYPNLLDKESVVYGSSSIHRFAVRDDSYSDAISFGASMAGVTLYYGLIVPTTSSGDAYPEIIEIEDYGTMGFAMSGALVAAPVGLDVFYPADYVLLLDDIYNRVNGDASDLVTYSEFPIPAPTGLADGTYKLVATVSGGVATLSWEADV